MNTISSDNPIAADVALDETMIPFIERENKTDLKQKSDSTFTLTLADQSKYPFPGKIYIIDRAVDPQTGTIKVRLLFDNPGNILKAGMSANLQILNNSNYQSLLIPYRACVEQMAEYFVYVVNEDTVAQRKVFLGQRIRDMVIVKSGLQENENHSSGRCSESKRWFKGKGNSSAQSRNGFIESSDNRFIKEKIILIRQQYDRRYFY